MVHEFIEGRHIALRSVFRLHLPSLVVLRVLPASIELVDLLLRLRLYQWYEEVKTLSELAYAR